MCGIDGGTDGISFCGYLLLLAVKNHLIDSK